jgi:prepilin-type N-terminal cleavage/methylation domain-containing protein
MIEKLQKMRKQEGFTLLELLVVVAIIAILATLILTNLTRARKQAQDAKVQSEVKAISDSIEIYDSSNPSGLTPTTNGVMTVLTSTAPGISALTTAPAGTDILLKVIPTHPLSTASPAKNYKYSTTTTATGFSYTVEGDLVSKTGCYTITDGVATTTGAVCP